ncbi:S-layer family protein [Stieleria mannarensis]|uniref:S-layer family protein n=1 Tax=Stieleria mannarensis TaxID=2755585 RepID=UPI001602A26A|nr:S-layer family protein [Rhodopirellula sp. JC639]
MTLSNWIQKLAGARLPVRRRRKERRRKDLVAELNVTRLETRRVLNGDALAGELVIDAGVDANDGHADAFHLTFDQDQLHVRVNGEHVNSVSIDHADAITIQGSADDDSLVVDLGDGSLAEQQIRFDGGEGRDHVRLVTAEHIQSLIHAINAPGMIQSELRSDSGTANLQWVGIETLSQDVTSDGLTVQLGNGVDRVAIDRSDSPGVSQIQVWHASESMLETQPPLTLSLDTPDEELRFVSDVDDESEGQQIEVRGLADSFAASLVFQGDAHDSIVFAGETVLGGGDLTVTAGHVQFESAVHTDHAAIEITATEELSLAESGSITNHGGTVRLTGAAIDVSGSIEASAGLVSLDSGDQGVTIVRGLIDVSSTGANGQGGVVHVLGTNVGLLDSARINASGAAGGGTVLIGGDYLGKGMPRNAFVTYVSQQSILRADATHYGHGGKVIVWADHTTRMHGTITARGGADDGDGGLIETSGKVTLDVSASSVNASAVSGVAGTWLLDPLDVIISDGSTQNNIPDSGGVFTPIGNNANIGDDIINAALDAGTNVTITTDSGDTNDDSDDGDIQLNANADIVLSTAQSVTLTLVAAGSIDLRGTVTASMGTLDIVLTANDNSGTQTDQNIAAGNVRIRDVVTTNGGTFTSSGVDFDNSGGAITSGDGQVTLTHTGEITVGAAIDAGVGDADLQTTGGDIVGGGTVTAATLTLNASGGIGVGTTFTTNVDTLDLTSGGTGNAGDITVIEADGASLSVATDATAQAVQITSTGGGLTVNSNSGDANDNVTLITLAGDVDGGATVTANLLTINASGGIGIGTAFSADATTYSLTSAGVGALGNITLVDTGSLNTSQISTLSSVASVQTVSLTATTGDLTIDAAIGNTIDHLNLTATAGDLVGGMTATAATLTLTAGGGIGIGTAVTANATTYHLTTAATGAAGNITFHDTNTLNTNQFATLSTAGTAQTVSLTADTGDLTVGTAIGNATDDLTLLATAGNVIGGATATAATLTINAGLGIGIGTTLQTDSTTLDLTSGGANATGNITVIEADAVSLSIATAAASAQTVSVTVTTGDLTTGGTIGDANDDISLIASSGNLVGGAAVTANSLTLNAGGGIGIGTAVNVNATSYNLTTAGIAAAGNIALVDNGDFNTNQIASLTTDASAQAISLTASTGNLTIGNAIGDTTDDLTLVATAGNIVGGATATAAALTLNAGGGIGIGTAVTADASSYSLTTSGTGAAGNISLIDSGALNTNQITTIATDATTQTVSLTASTGDLTAGAAIGDAADNVTLISSAGDVVGGASVTAATLTINAAGGIGIGTAFNADAATLALTSGGLAAAGNITLIEADAANLSIATDASAQTVDVTITSGDLTINGAIGDANDNINLTASGGNVLGGATVTADTLTVVASGGIGIGTAFSTDANTLDLTTAGVGAAGDITVIQADAASLMVSTDASGQTISVTLSTGDFTVGGALGDGNDSLTFIASAGDIIGGGTVTANALTLDASGGIGIGTAVTANAATYNLTSGGVGAAGDITLIDTGALNTNQITTLSTAGSTQTISLTATTGDLTVGGSIGHSADDLNLTALAGDIVGGAGTAIAATLTLDASGGIGIGTAVNVNATSYDLTTAAVGSAGNIALVDTGAFNTNQLATLSTDASAQTVSLTASTGNLTIGTAIGDTVDDLTLIATAGNIVGGATATAATLTLNAGGGIGIGTAVTASATSYSLTTAGSNAAGNITLIDTGALNTNQITLATDGTTQTISLTATTGDLTAGAAIGDAADNLTLVSSAGNVVGGSLVTAAVLTINAAGGIGIGTAFNSDAATLALTSGGLAAAGNITIIEADATNLSIATDASAQTVDVTITAGDLTVNGAIGDANDNVNLTTSGGNVVGGATVTADTLTVNASGGIGVGTALSTDANTLDLTTAGLGAAGDITVIQADAASLMVSTDASGQTISVTLSTGDFTVGGALGDGNDSLTFIASAGDIVGGGTVTANALTLNASGGIGIGTAVTANANTYSLTSGGVGAAGNITLIDTGALDTSQITTLSTAGSSQTISLTATTGDLTVGGSLGHSGDDLNLTAVAGDIVGGAGTATAATLTLDASGGIGIGTAVNANATSYDLTTAGIGSAGNIALVDTGALNTNQIASLTTDASAQLVSLTASTGNLTIGNAIGDTADDLTLVATVGNIVGGASATAATLTLNAGGGIGIGTAVTADASSYSLTTSGTGAAGNISLIDSGALNTNQITTIATDATTQTVSLTASTGNLTLGSAIGNGTDNLTLVSTTGDVVGGATATAETLTVTASGAIGNGSALMTDANTLNLTTSGVGLAGNITVIQADAANLSVTTDASAQTINVTVSTGDFTLGGAIGDGNDSLALSATAGNIVGGGTVTANDLTLSAGGGIGIGTAVTADATTYSLTSAGIGAAGDITLVDAGALNTNQITTLTTDASSQTIRLTAAGGDLTIGGAIGDGNDNLTFIATAGDIVGGGTVTANLLTLDANGGIGIGTAVTANAATYSLTSSGAAAAGDITLVDTGALNTNQITTLSTAGSSQTIRLTATSGNVTVGGAIGDATDNLNLTAFAGNIVGGGATLTASTVTLNASGGIGIGTAVAADASGYSLISAGVGSAGNIRLVDVNALNTSQVALTTDASSQTVELTASTGDMTINNAIGDTVDNLTLRALVGDVVGGATATANQLRLEAGGGIGIGTAVTADATTYHLTSAGNAAAGNIMLFDTGTLNTAQVTLSTDVSAQLVRLDALGGDLIVGGAIGNATDSLTLSAAAGNVVGGATATAATLTVAASGGIGIGTVLSTTADTLDLTTTGVGAAGNIRVVESDASTYSVTTDASAQLIQLTQIAGDFTIGGAIGDGGDSLTFVATTGDIVGGGTVTADALVLQAGGGIGVGTAVTANATSYNLTTSGAGSDGDITLIDTNSLSTSQITGLSTATTTQTVSLTASTGNLTVDAAIGEAGDHLVLSATNGNVVGGATATAANLTVVAGGGIGIGTALQTDADNLDLTTSGSNGAGNITVVEADAVNLSITTAASSQSVSVTVSNGNLTVNSAIGDANDDLVLITSSGDVVGGGLVTADTLTVNSSGGIGNGVPLQTDANTLDLTSAGVGAAGDIRVVQADAANLLIATDASAQTISVTLSTGDFTVGGAIGDGNDSLMFAATSGNIVGGGTVTANDLTLSAGGGIGIGTAVTADAATYNLTTAGVGAAGNISLVSGGGLNTAQVTLATDASVQTIDLTASSGDLVVGAAIGNTTDHLTLRTGAGNVVGGASASAATLTVVSSGGIGVGTALGTNADVLNLTTDGSGAAGNITVVESDAVDLSITTAASAQTVDITVSSGNLDVVGPIGDANDDLSLTASTGNVGGGSTVTANTLTVKAGGGIGIGTAFDTNANTINLTSAGIGSAGNITIVEADSANLMITTDGSAQTIDVTISSGDFNMGGAIGDANDDLRFATPAGNINGGAAVTANSLTLSAGGGIGIATAVVADAASYDLTSAASGAAGNINLIDTGALNTSQITGLSTHGSTQSVTLTASAGPLTVDGAIGNTSDDLTLIATSGDLIGGSVATAGVLRLSAAGGIGIGTAISADANSYELSSSGTGAAGDISLINQGALNTSQITALSTDASTQTISLATSSGDLTLDTAIAHANDNFALTASGGAVQQSGGAITANGLSVDAMTGIDLGTTVSALSAINRGSGDIQIAETDAITIINANQLGAGDVDINAGGTIVVDNGRSAADAITTVGGAISVQASGAASDLVVVRSISSGSGQINLSADDDLTILGAGRVTTGNNDAVGVSIAANADGAGSGSLTLNDSAIVATNKGRISGVLVNSGNPISGVQVGERLGGTQRNAEIDVTVNDPSGLGFVAQVDWLEGNPGDSDPARRNPLEQDISTGGVAANFQHSYDVAPNQGDIIVNVALTSIADGSIVLTQNATDVLDRPEFTTTVTLQVEGALLPFSAPLPESDSVTFVRTIEQIVITTPATQRIVVVAPPLQLNNSVGSAVVTSQRYYVLRIVSFGAESEGEVKLWDSEQGREEYSLPDLEDPDSGAGFELSQLPELFKRLPDDRYRIYLIEGQTERLVLDFIIRDGQPIEAQTDAPVQSEHTPAEEGDADRTDADQEALPPKQLDAGAGGGANLSSVERLGSVPVVSSGGIILAAGIAKRDTMRDARGSRRSSSQPESLPTRRYRNQLSARRPASWR